MRSTTTTATAAALLLFVFFLWAPAISSFSPSPSITCHRPSSQQLYLQNNFQESITAVDKEWTSLTDDGGVKIRVISPPSPSSNDNNDNNDTAEEGEDLPDLKGKDVTVEYIGSIASRNWSVNDVIDCWLPDQGLSTSLAPELFKAFDVDYKRLTNSTKFGIKFIKEGLGVLKESKQTTLFEAAQSLKQSDMLHVPGTVFDKNTFSFRPNKGQVIKAFDLAIGTMQVGQTCSILARCDYAYGSKGLRMNGKVVVPPYATVQYEVTFIEVK
jgi:hypothetical protein